MYVSLVKTLFTCHYFNRKHSLEAHRQAELMKHEINIKMKEWGLQGSHEASLIFNIESSAKPIKTQSREEDHILK